MRGILWSWRALVLELDEDFFDVPQEGNFTGTLLIIPFQGETEIFCFVPPQSVVILFIF